MHNLMVLNGQASMFYIDETPWHGLGTRLNRPATAKRAIQAANLDWSVSKAPVFTTVNSQRLLVPDTFAVVRNDPLMAHVKVNASRLMEYLTEVFKPSDPTDEGTLIRAERNRDWARTLLRRRQRQPSSQRVQYFPTSN